VGHRIATLAVHAYDKDEMADLTPLQRKALKEMIKQELDARRKQ
jgi:hypothetical protein